jgi:dihydropteroate synthase
MKHAETMIADGADILEIGGESSGPSSEDVSSEEELRRVLPVIEALRLRFPSTRLAVDTTKAIVAKEALLRGVCMINDVTAGRSDPHILHVCAEYACDFVLMYSKNDSPRTTIEQKMYTDIIATIHSFFEERIESAVIAGIARENIIVDPGLGHFLSSDPQYSFEVLKQLSRFSDLGSVFISPSRKSFLAGPRNLPANERLPATLAATMLALQNGASFIRTHDVAETREVVEVWGKISDEREASS